MESAPTTPPYKKILAMEDTLPYKVWIKFAGSRVPHDFEGSGDSIKRQIEELLQKEGKSSKDIAEADVEPW